tara:strand:- start:2119 stop:2469 length:351 start_codon:yes stop_codon:yes gene_type:complete
VTIYKFPESAVSSIANRITGVLLSGAYVATGTLYFCPVEYKLLQDNWYPIFQSDTFKKHFFVSSLSFPISYHTLGGLRHFLWDKYPSFLTNRIGKISSYTILGSSLILTSAANIFV